MKLVKIESTDASDMWVNPEMVTAVVHTKPAKVVSIYTVDDSEASSEIKGGDPDEIIALLQGEDPGSDEWMFEWLRDHEWRLSVNGDLLLRGLAANEEQAKREAVEMARVLMTSLRGFIAQTKTS